MKTEGQQAAFEAVDKLGRFVNVMGDSTRINLLIDAMANDHRTIQQGFTRLAVAWLKHLAALPEGQYDGRNEASVKLARKLLKDVDVKFDLFLPLV